MLVINFLLFLAEIKKYSIVDDRLQLVIPPDDSGGI